MAFDTDTIRRLIKENEESFRENIKHYDEIRPDHIELVTDPDYVLLRGGVFMDRYGGIGFANSHAGKTYRQLFTAYGVKLVAKKIKPIPKFIFETDKPYPYGF